MRKHVFIRNGGNAGLIVFLQIFIRKHDIPGEGQKRGAVFLRRGFRRSGAVWHGLALRAEDIILCSSGGGRFCGIFFYRCCRFSRRFDAGCDLPGQEILQNGRLTRKKKHKNQKKQKGDTDAEDQNKTFNKISHSRIVSFFTGLVKGNPPAAADPGQSAGRLRPRERGHRYRQDRSRCAPGDPGICGKRICPRNCN